MTAGVELTESDLAEVLRLVSDEGQRIGTVARFFGVTRQALYMRKLRNEDFAIALAKAEACNEMREKRLLDEAVARGLKTWVGHAWKLERRHSSHKGRADDPEDRGWLSAEVQHRIEWEIGPSVEVPERDERFE